MVVFLNLTQTRVTWLEDISTEELLPSDWPVGMSIGAFFLIYDCYGRVQPIVGGATTGQGYKDIPEWYKKEN